MSDIEGKVTRVGARECGQRTSFKSSDFPQFGLTPIGENAHIAAVRTNRTMLVALALLLTVTAPTFAANALMGTWKLNEGKSKFAPGATKNTTVTYAPAKGDMVKCTVEGVDKDGKLIHWTWVGKFDGKPYQIKGSPSFDTLTYKPVNDRTNETTATKAGKVVMTGTITVAKDGKSRVVRLTGTDANGQKFTDMTYYDKQH